MTRQNPLVTRFAPSPTGLLHLGHAYAACFAANAAKKQNGRFLLRLEDIDQGRCRPEFEDAIFEDLAWLGLSWEHPIRRQSKCLDAYQTALDQLTNLGLLYPCFCTRKEILAEIHSSQNAPHLPQDGSQGSNNTLGPNGPDGPLYPGTCRLMAENDRHKKIADGVPFALRLDMRRAIKHVGALSWTNIDAAQTSHIIPATPEIFGDVVLARKDIPTSYHLAVTVDDADQGISLVTRGQDLFAATHIHRLLQNLLNLPTPMYHHHPVICGPDGHRLAKRDQAQTLGTMRAAGTTTDEIHAYFQTI